MISLKGCRLASTRGSTLKPEGKEPTLRLQCLVYTSQSHCACIHLALQGREWPWGSHPTATSRIVKVAMVKCYYEAIAEIRRVDNSFHDDYAL